MEIFIILILTFTGAFFAFAEFGLVSAKRSRLETAKKNGNKNAAIALKLLENPEQFLSTMQVGLTGVAIISGYYGEAALAGKFAHFLSGFPIIEPYAESAATFSIILVITYLTIVIGELVPKTIALRNPEPIALAMAPIVLIFTKLTYPVVAFLSWSTKMILKLLLIDTQKEQSISEDELVLMVKMADQQGVLEHKESEFIQNILRFADRDAYTIMTHKNDVEWVDINSPMSEIDQTIRESGYTKFLVCEDDLENILGVVKLSDYIQAYGKPGFDIKNVLTHPILIPESLSALKILEKFRHARNYFAVVVDEFGSTQGIITLHDLTENIFGNLPDGDDDHIPNVIHREDGSLLVEGSTPIDELKEAVPIADFNYEDTDYSTLAGFILSKLDAIPSAGDHFIEEGFRFEVMDMDKSKVDKVLISKILEVNTTNN
jgi:putative hemolysin